MERSIHQLQEEQRLLSFNYTVLTVLRFSDICPLWHGSRSTLIYQIRRTKWLSLRVFVSNKYRRRQVPIAKLVSLPASFKLSLCSKPTNMILELLISCYSCHGGSHDGPKATTFAEATRLLVPNIPSLYSNLSLIRFLGFDPKPTDFLLLHIIRNRRIYLMHTFILAPCFGLHKY